MDCIQILYSSLTGKFKRTARQTSRRPWPAALLVLFILVFPSCRGHKEQPPIEAVIEPVIYPDNVMDINFDALHAAETDANLRDMHNYFRRVKPTKQNKYTGMFRGKNLVWICAESFSNWAIDPKLTPTLAKLKREGFVFKNYYNPSWLATTSDGEYTSSTGLIPKQEAYDTLVYMDLGYMYLNFWSYYASASNYMPFAMGTQLKNFGYSNRAYHNYRYDFYRRDRSHPNMGYEFKAVGRGLELSGLWPESDLDMMKKSLPEYIADPPFHTYYMTMSGHLEYNFYGNQMAMKHEAETAGLPYSEAARAYIAGNMEFEAAVAYLIEQIDSAGMLDDTVFVISNDHYPYGLGRGDIEQLNHGPVEENFELYRAPLIIWNSAMEEPVIVDKPCDPIDILPTLSNLMGLGFDSRLMAGRDILDEDDEGLAVLSNRSWISGKGRYNAETRTFTPTPGAFTAEAGQMANEVAYIAEIKARVENMFSYSVKILETDYYRVIFPKGLIPKH
jgi:phosphoglycerol transferase MdoB-like AlkP superfamily enzyme